MAKKKTAAKKTAKKAVKKTASPKKSPKSVKKVAKKAPTKLAKKATKKTAPKKVVSKKALVKKTVKKTTVKKAVAKKTVAKKAAAPKKAVAVASTNHLLRAAVEKTPKKALDLSGFVTPLDDRLMIQVSSAERKTPGGLFIPDTVADTSGNLEGVVVAVGRGHMDKKGRVHPMDVKVGDQIVFPQYAGSKIKIQNEDLIILRESEVMGVVSK